MRARALGCGCARAFVAQGLEHWSRKPGVESSNLSGGNAQLRSCPSSTPPCTSPRPRPIYRPPPASHDPTVGGSRPLLPSITHSEVPLASK